MRPVGLLIVVVAIALPLATIRESFWIDETHSAWVIDGPWKQVNSRSQIGNQSPFYYYGLKLWAETLALLQVDASQQSLSEGNAEWILRSFSWLPWMLMIGFLGYLLRKNAVQLMSLGIWLAVDRIGAFYAIETRPYAWVMFSGFLMMHAAAKALTPHRRWRIAWLFWSTLTFYLHYTAILAVALSWIVRVAITLRSSGGRQTIVETSCHKLGIASSLQKLLVDGLAFGIVSIPGLWMLTRSADRAAEWQAFAGRTNWRSLFDLLPWLCWLVVPAIGLAFDLVFRRLRGRPVDSRCVGANDEQERLLQQCAWVSVGLIASTWVLTSLEVAPLMHRRYLIVAYPGLIVAGLILLGRIQMPTFQIAVIATSLLILGSSQGTFREWQAGRWLAWQRQEDWRGVAAFLRKSANSDDLLAIAPRLIETAPARLPDRVPNDYLTCPLRGPYDVSNVATRFALPNSENDWEVYLSEAWDTDQRIWIVVRGAFDEQAFNDLLRRLNADDNRSRPRGYSMEVQNKVKLLRVDSER